MEVCAPARQLKYHTGFAPHGCVHEGGVSPDSSDGIDQSASVQQHATNVSEALARSEVQCRVAFEIKGADIRGLTLRQQRLHHVHVPPDRRQMQRCQAEAVSAVDVGAVQ